MASMRPTTMHFQIGQHRMMQQAVRHVPCGLPNFALILMLLGSQGKGGIDAKIDS